LTAAPLVRKDEFHVSLIIYEALLGFPEHELLVNRLSLRLSLVIILSSYLNLFSKSLATLQAADAAKAAMASSIMWPVFMGP
jgi:hypothetical protein